MKKSLLLSLLFILINLSQAYCQNSLDFMDKISGYDISSIFVESESPEKHSEITIDKTEPIGYFGGNYQRFFIHYISVIQNRNNPLEYLVYGKTKLKENISSFQGKMNIIECKIFDEAEIPGYYRGYATLEYEFFEDPLNGGTGKFIGNCVSSFFIDDENNLYYDAFYWGADSFDNNQFEGTWVSYESGKSYDCNWGDFRIPNSKGLDTGTGEFKVLERYLKNGWETYQYSMGYGFPPTVSEEQIENAKAIESEEWWK